MKENSVDWLFEEKDQWEEEEGDGVERDPCAYKGAVVRFMAEPLSKEDHLP